MMFPNAPDHRAYRDWREWAAAIRQYLAGNERDKRKIAPQAVLLDRLTSEARAIEEGVLLYDAVNAEVVVSIGGAWVALGGGVGGSVAWADVTGKPATFSPSAHSHAISDVTGLATALSDKADAVHGHIISDVSGLTTALSGKADVSHNHVASDVTDFSEAVDDRVAAFLVAGANVTLTHDDGANTLTIAASGGGSVTSYNAKLGADVALTVSNQWYDGPSLVGLPAGTYLVTAHATHYRTTTTAGRVQARITDGTTHRASAEYYHASVAGIGTTLAMSTIVTLVAPTTLKIQMATTAGVATSLMKAATANNGSGNNATQITALKLA